MDMFFENREISGRIQVHQRRSHIFPAHFHLDLEIFLLRKGSYTVSVNEVSYDVTDGGVVVVDSYKVHSYDQKNGEVVQDSCVVIIPYKYLAKFNANRKYFKIKSPVFYDKTLCEKLMTLADEYLQADCSEAVKEAAADMFLALLSERLVFTEEKLKDEGVLIRSILAYVQERYKGEISLVSTARHLGYSPAYISRSFHKYIKMSLSEYINRLRLEYIKEQKAKDSSRKIIDLIYEAGFKSQQTYYRCKALLQ